ncbi:hypothetical protein CR513_08113, partial [Mucuna pruriens]
MTKQERKGHFSYRNWRNYALRPMKTPRSISKRKEFKVGKKVFLFHSRLKLIVGKLRCRWDRPFVITNVFPYGVVEVRDEANYKTFQVNGHQLKHFHEGLTPIVGDVDNISLLELAKPNDTL